MFLLGIYFNEQVGHYLIKISSYSHRDEVFDRNPNPPLNGETGGLVHVNRPQGCIFPRSDGGQTQEISEVFCLQGERYQYTCHPFGYRLSPITFSQCVKLALGVLLCKGLQVAWYPDDLLIMAVSPELAIYHTLELMEFMQYMGFNINWKKSAPWPSCQATYLGLCLDAVSMTPPITQERWAVTGDVLEQCIPGGRIRYVLVKRLLGLLSSAHQVIPLRLLYMRRLQLWYKGIHRRIGDKPQVNSRLVLVPLEIASVLDHWHRAVTNKSRRPDGLQRPGNDDLYGCVASGLGGHHGPT